MPSQTTSQTADAGFSFEELAASTSNIDPQADHRTRQQEVYTLDKPQHAKVKVYILNALQYTKVVIYILNALNVAANQQYQLTALQGLVATLQVQ